ncbi:hypothetical protein [Caulobacter endophyticus]|uniref:restriction endonuclease subunit S n=1 Tax=Caulobacter endophyticus TaxID=2172652 RepID=UPI00240F3A9D|nr:hypothetical protein [Caulobacter endophyticus]MDG2531018.1 hypothetical protein [Caulobacter endophyticus]
MSFPAYESYKDSGLDWLGAVPDHWRLAPFWSLFRRTKRTGFPDAELLSVYRDYGVIRKADRDDNFNNASEDLSTYQLVEPGDLAMNKMKAWQGSLGVSAHKGIVSPAYFVFQAQHAEDPAFLHYLLRSGGYAVGFMTISKGIRIGQWDLDPDHLGTVPIPLPPLGEQRAIAAFLDRETAKIDALVGAQRQLIELLKEKRQAVISHAVTKGLDPSVPMKDSGIEWLGQVPAHWEAVPLKRYLTVLSGYAFPSAGFADDAAEVPLLRGVNVGVGRVRWDEVVYWPKSETGELAAWQLALGDLVIGMDRPWIAEGLRLAEVAEQDLPCLLLQRVAALRTLPGLTRDYLKLTLQGEAFYHHCVPEMTGVSVPHISPGQIYEFVVAVPPHDEQEQISKLVKSVSGDAEQLVAAGEEAIALLQERRAALISAAVTGKIDVRGLVVDAESAEAA